MEKLKQKIVTGQHIDPGKATRAKELRHQMTEEEEILWEKLRANRLNGFHFRRQQIIDGFIVDFYCHAARLVIEVDGKIHDNQIEYDTQRDQILRAKDLQILRITNTEIHTDLETVLQSIKPHLHQQST
jgi:very-short-patch-repair endonuclease